MEVAEPTTRRSAEEGHSRCMTTRNVTWPLSYLEQGNIESAVFQPACL